MPLVIAQTFPLGRFHATRWNQNPFEDRFGEWPPSPWRLLRALAARWFQYQRETGESNTASRDQLLGLLAGALPSYRLPEATWRGNEIRQYLPTAIDPQYNYKKNSRTGKRELESSYRKVTTTLSADSYRAVPTTEELLWIWPKLTLPTASHRLLDELLRRMHYFGRAET